MRTWHPSILVDLRSRYPLTLLRTEKADESTDLAQAIGLLPELSVVAALGLLITAIADNAGRVNSSWAYPASWLGLLVVFVPIALRLSAATPVRLERVGLVCLLAGLCYLVKVLGSPLGFTFSDEFQHWRSANDILASGHLFSPNPLLDISPRYPGLEIATDALASSGGIPIFLAGTVLIGIAKVILVLGLFLLYERASGSSLVAGLASLIYMGNPNFLFWSSQFAYESLAVPLAVIAVLALVYRHGASRSANRLLAAVAVISIAAVIPTHHVTSALAIGFLLLWATLTYWLRWRAPAPVGDPVAWWPGLLLAVGTGLWTILVAPEIVPYVRSPLRQGAIELLQIVQGRQPAHPFMTAAGQVQQTWERALAVLTTGVLTVLLPLGLLQLWRRYRRSSLMLALAFTAAVYPLTQPLRITRHAGEFASRLSDFDFVGLGLVVALAAVHLCLNRRPGILGQGLVAGLATLIFMGGVVAWPPYARIPGPYLIEGGPRAIEPQSLGTAGWMQRTLGPGHRVAADQANRLLLGSYGEQDVISARPGSLSIWPLFFSRQLDAEGYRVLRVDRVSYVLVDLRLSSGPPYAEMYFDPSEPPYRNGQLDRMGLLKFDRVDGASRIYDSGPIVIYDVSQLGAGHSGPRG